MKPLLFSIVFSLSGLVSFSQSTVLNSSFGNKGTVNTEVGSETSVIRATAIQADKKIVAAGTAADSTDRVFAITRYNTNGSLDNTFDEDGKVMTSFGTEAEISSIVIQADGKIVAGGYMYNDSTRVFAMARYNSNGTLDITFGNGGKITTAIGNIDDEIKAVCLQADGKIVAVGYTNASQDNNYYLPQIAVVRYNIDGSLDNSFSNDGIAITTLGDYDAGFSAVIQTDGKIIVAGTHLSGNDYQFLMVRYNIDGSLDNTFNGNGVTITSITGYYDVAYAVKIQKNGKIIVAGTAAFGDNYDSYGVVMARYNTNGSLDNTFHNDGKVITSLNSYYDMPVSLEIDSDGKILLAASISDNGVDQNINLLRYNTNGNPDSTFDKNGKMITHMNESQFIYALQLSGSELYVAGSEDEFFMAAYSYNLSALPLTLFSFTASLQNNTTKLQWQTTEQGFSVYTIERSVDAKTFISIGELAENTNTITQKSYSFIDNKPVQGVNYYRLKMTNDKSSYTYSKVVKVMLDNSISMKIFPNPTTDFLQIEIPSIQRGNIGLQILDVAGKVILKQTVTAGGTALSTSMNVTSLTKGNYMLLINSETKSQVQKFIKQ